MFAVQKEQRSMGRGACAIIRFPSVVRSVIVPRSDANCVTTFNSSLEEGAKMSIFNGRDVIANRASRDAV